MTRKRKIDTQERLLPTASPSIAISSDAAHITRIEAAMLKIARVLPDNAALSPVWARLEEMHAEAVIRQVKETKAQMSARRWLIAQNEMPSSSIAISANGKPAP